MAGCIVAAMPPPQICMPFRLCNLSGLVEPLFDLLKIEGSVC